MRYCCPRGIPVTRFTERRVGRPEWTDTDIDAALEWQLEQDWRCTGCGQDMRETFGPDHVDKWNAALSGHCDGCRAGERARSTLAGDDKIDPNAGARLRYWRDEEATDGRVDDPGPAVGETEPAGV